MTLAYYGVGMALSVLAVAILIIYRVARALPGGRAMKAGAGASAAVAALVVPSEHLSAVVEGYVHLCLKPVSLVARAVYEQNPDEAGLPYALAATIVMLAGAAIGLWVVRRWMIDAVPGGVAPSGGGFACVFLSAAFLWLFSIFFFLPVCLCCFSMACALSAAASLCSVSYTHLRAHET